MLAIDKLADLKQAVSDLDRRTVKLAYQIKDFVRSGHQSAGLVKPSTGELINHITSQLQRSIDVATTAESSSARSDRARSRSLEPSLYYPVNWPIDKSEFKKSLASFIKSTQQLIELLQPLADDTLTTKGTPSKDSLSEAEPRSLRLSAPISAISTATSTEEAIYQNPIKSEREENKQANITDLNPNHRNF